LDQLVKHKAALFCHLQERWKDLFAGRFDVLLYDLTSTYFESGPPFAEGDKRRFGYSRDKRFDCVQVVIALVPGNTLDKKTLGRHSCTGHTTPQRGLMPVLFLLFWRMSRFYKDVALLQ
jgi:hypothetical protein